MSNDDRVDGAPFNDERIPEAEDSRQEGETASPEDKIAGETADG